MSYPVYSLNVSQQAFASLGRLRGQPGQLLDTQEPQRRREDLVVENKKAVNAFVGNRHSVLVVPPRSRCPAY